MNKMAKIGIGIGAGVVTIGSTVFGVIKYRQHKNQNVEAPQQNDTQGEEKRLGWKSRKHKEEKRLGWKKDQTEDNYIQEEPDEPTEETKSDSPSEGGDEDDEDPFVEEHIGYFKVEPKEEPYEISMDDFDLAEADGYSKNFLTWYMVDEALADEFDELVIGPEKVLGEEIVHKLENGEYSTTGPIYVANDILGSVYEISIQNLSFAREFLGEGGVFDGP